MQERTFEVIACWNKGGTARLENTDGKLSLQLVGGEYGSWKERKSMCFEDISSSIVSISFVFGVNLKTEMILRKSYMYKVPNTMNKAVVVVVYLPFFFFGTLVKLYSSTLRTWWPPSKNLQP